jgi:type IV pilus secretin PilQ/predicted competence protein
MKTKNQKFKSFRPICLGLLPIFGFPAVQAQTNGFNLNSPANSQLKAALPPPIPTNNNSGNSSNTTSTGPVADAIAAGAGEGDAAGQSDLISLEYRNAPLLEVIRTLADAANINITLSSEVEKGSPVSIRLTKVTYEQALKAILDTYKFGAILENGILKIDTLANLTAVREERLKEKESGWKSQPTKRLVWQVNYAKAVDLVELLKTMLKAYSIDPRFSIIADKRTNKIIIEGISDALVESKGILENLDRRKQQVLIEARIVEASSELSKTLSVTWGTRFGFDGNRGLANGLIFPNSMTGSVGGAGALGSSAPNPGLSKAATQLGTMQFTVGSINNLINIDAILRAYETEALANVIASPRVVVQDQEKATIKEDISLSRGVLGPDGKPEARTTVANLELVVSPQVTSDNTLELDIQVQRQTPTNAPSDPVQGSIKRQANTKLIVANGETAVIGGLYQTQKFKGQGRIPFLGRLPLIGALFRTNEEQSFRSELMVLITPRILPGGGSRSSVKADLPIGTNSANTGGNNFANNSNNSGDNASNTSGGTSNEFGNTASNATGGSAASNLTSPGNSAKATAPATTEGGNNFGNAADFGPGGDLEGPGGTSGGETGDIAKAPSGGNGNLNNLGANDGETSNSGGNSAPVPGTGGGNGNFNNLNGGSNSGGDTGGADNLNNLNGGDL